VVLDIYVLSAVMINMIFRNADCTLIITWEGDFAQILAKVSNGLPHPE
jgi:hypothetical protein